MTVKDLLHKLANCQSDATVNVAITDGLEVKMYPATNVQILSHNLDGKEIKVLMVITNTSKNEN